MITLGFSKHDITPTHSVKLAGYMPMREATGIHDRLRVRSHAFFDDDNQTMTILSSVDLVAIDQMVTDRVKAALKEKYPGWTVHLLISASHTHSGPAGTLNTNDPIKRSIKEVFGEWDEEYVGLLVGAIVDSVVEAYAKRANFRYKTTVEHVQAVGKDRHHKDLPADDRLLVFEFENKWGRTLLYNYACHPTVLKGENNLISADLPVGVINHLAGYYMIQFINGAAGNISTRFTRKTSDFEQIDEFGKILADSINYVTQAQWQTLSSLRVEEVSYQVESKLLDGSYTNEMDLLLSRVLNKPHTITLNFSILRFDDLTLLSVPGELDSSLVSEFYVLGYTNDYWFYLSPEHIYDDDEYEAKSSFLKRGEIERVMFELKKRISVS